MPLKKELLEFVFTHLERVAVCAGLVVAGAFLGQHPEEGPDFLLQSAALVLILGGALLFVVNLIEGLRSLRAWGVSGWWVALVGGLVYSSLSVLFAALVRMNLVK